MDFLTDELERMAVNLAEYTGPALGSEIPLDNISGASHLQAHRHAAITDTSPRTKPTPSLNSEYLMTAPNLASLLTHLSSHPTIPRLPPPITGTAEDGTPTLFLRIPAATKHAIETHLASTVTQDGLRPPAFVRLSIAPKDLCPDSARPTLGIDASLPQHRGGPPRRPRQHEYPVWYFFYGTLAEPGRLRDVVGAEPPVLARARVRGGVVRTWAGRYRALVDGGEGDVVEGWAGRVGSEEEEGALRAYETEAYEVVRCRIEVEGEAEGEVWGCTFRFAGERTMLS